MLEWEDISVFSTGYIVRVRVGGTVLEELTSPVPTRSGSYMTGDLPFDTDVTFEVRTTRGDLVSPPALLLVRTPASGGAPSISGLAKALLAVSIVGPTLQSHLIQLSVTATDDVDGTLGGTSIHWVAISNTGRREEAFGSVVTLLLLGNRTFCQPGTVADTYEITVTATDSEGNSTSTTITHEIINIC